jgi:endonuclease/exonuclease/phosphatase family metal-dependent hydrolase
MKAIIKKRLTGLFLFLNIGCIVATMAALPAPYMDPVKYWPVALAGLAFPGLVILLVLFCICWLFIKPKRSFYSLAAILVCIPAIYVTFGLHFFSSFKEEKDNTTLRVLSWNVGLMNYTTLDTAVAIKNNLTIFNKINNANADIVCLQEFFTNIVPGNHYNVMDSLSKILRYPYYYFSGDLAKVDGNFFRGSIIFSRYKIVDSSKAVFPFTGLYGGSIIRTGIVYKNDTINVFTSRLQLMTFQGDEYKELHNIKTVSGNSIADTKSMIGKLRYGYYFLSQQADFVRQVLDSSKRPVIFAGDLNNIPLSYTYGKVKGDLNDAWAAKGKGFGRTFQYISPTLRVDHLFYGDHFKLLQVKRIIEEGETDHHGLLADMRINAK